MFHDPVTNQRGMGLITAVFIIVVVGMFGVLIARYATISSVVSAEDYIWAQALCSAESTIRLNILGDDGGGGIPAPVNPTVGGVQAYPATRADGVTPFVFIAPGNPVTIKVQAKHGTGVSRTVESKYML